MVDYLLGFLFFGTIGAAILFAWRSSQVTEDRLHDDSDPASTLASDGPDTRS